MRANYLLFLLLLWSTSLMSQDSRIAKGTREIQYVPLEIMPHMDNEELKEEELSRREPGLAPKFAKKIPTDIRPESHGLWEKLPNGQMVWRLLIYSAGAKSLNLGFTKYKMPQGGTLILYTPDGKKVIGPFTPADNEEHEQLWTPILEGDELVIEVKIPQKEKKNLQLVLSAVNHDFLGFAQIASGSCNLDVICGAADGWGMVDQYRHEIRSVANIGVAGDSYCTGFLINNTRNDQTPYFMTADHCGFSNTTAATLVAYWRFESNSCRPPNSGASGSTGNGDWSIYNTGAYFRAAYGPSDFTLLELDDPVPIAAAPFMAGWSIADQSTTDTVVCIHHPNNDEKRISFEFDPTYLGLWGRDADYVPNGNHLIIPDWDIGTTEGGSSGAPLFNKNKEVIGQLHGGYAACNNDEYDSFGRFFSSWEGGGTPQTRLKDWLNPDNLNVQNWPGRDLYSELFAMQTFQEICLPGNPVFTLQIGTGFEGEVTLTLPGFPTEAGAEFSVNPVTPGGTSILTIHNPEVLPAGEQNILVAGSDGTNTKNLELTLSVFEGLPEEVSLAAPADQALDVPAQVMLSWDTPLEGMTYDVEVAKDVDFVELVETANEIIGNHYQVESLESLTVYFWRVRGRDVCGIGPWSATRTFTTSIVVCGLGNVTSNNPVTISGSGMPTISSTLYVAESMNIARLKISNLTIRHSWIGDLEAELQSPEGTVVRLFVQPSEGDCNANDILVTFEDAAPNAYEEFDQMCNANGIGIEGAFQPLEPLSTFVGEDAQGVWTLRIKDKVDQDGGFLESWSIDFCATVPAIVGVYPQNEITETCPGQTAEVKVQTGLGYQGEVMLSLEGLPSDVTTNITPNPIAPGGFATITIDGLQTLGSYTATVTGTNGGDMASKDFTLVVRDIPSAFSTTTPLANAVDVPTNVDFAWAASDYADAYQITIRRDSVNGPLVLTQELTETTYSIFLGASKTFFWEVLAKNICGEYLADGGSFRTEGPLTFNAVPSLISICKGQQNQVQITVGSGFLAPVNLSHTVLPSGNFDLTYSVDPAMVQPGQQLTVTIAPPDNLPVGFYDIQFTAEDNVHSTQSVVNVVVKDKPAPASLANPANGATEVTTQPVFLWTAIPEISFYAIQIATDEAFGNIIESTSVTTNSFSPQKPLNGAATYYWRVYAYNNCGNSVSSTAEFSTLLTSLRELSTSKLELYPNPVKDQLQIRFTPNLQEAAQLQLYHSNGQLMLEKHLPKGSNIALLPVNDFPNALYFIRLLSDGATRTERIVIQH